MEKQIDPMKVIYVREKVEEPIVRTELKIAQIYPFDPNGNYRKRSPEECNLIGRKRKIPMET